MSTSTTGPVRQFKPRRALPERQKSIGNPFGSDLFPTRRLDFQSGLAETVVIGGREQFPLVGRAFDAAGIKKILFIGWGSQGPAQSQNLRDTLKTIGRNDIKVSVGLRSSSKSIDAAKAAGFTSETGTLGDPYRLAQDSDLVICLIADGGMVQTHNEIFGAAKRGATIGISHGFIAGHLDSLGQPLPQDRNFLMVAPKGMGPSVRSLYVQGADKEGAGINSSVAIQAVDGKHDILREVANAWSVGIGSPVTFGTDFLAEVRSDLFGERSMLLGGLWATTEALYEYFSQHGRTENNAFRVSSSGITGTVTDALSEMGIAAFHHSLTPDQKAEFNKGYVIGYPVFDQVMGDIYADVASGEEIRRVIEDTRWLSERPMESVEKSSVMWKYAREHSLYGERPAMENPLAFSAGVYVGGIMAQLHTLLHHGHNVSETINESLIEAVDSLTPYMHARGVAHMVDNCSTTARLGTRRWGPVFKKNLGAALASFAAGDYRQSDDHAAIMETLFDRELHHDIGICMGQRPSVRISVPLA